MRIEQESTGAPATSIGLPLLILATILISYFLFLLAMFSWFMTRGCQPIFESWFVSGSRNWPLAASFILVFFLLFVWNAAVILSPARKSVANRVILGLNVITLLAIAVLVNSLFDSAQVSRLEALGANKWIATSMNLPWPDKACQAATPYLGRWMVIDIQADPDADPFPTRWIELRDDLSFRAADSLFGPVVEGRWAPQITKYRWGDRGGWIGGPAFYAHWDFHLDGDRLELRTPDWAHYLPQSRVILERTTNERPN